jgi:SAM-dependent methyltransferase
MQQTKPGRIVWGKGDFGAVAPLVSHVGEDVVDAADVREGEAVLDVACGTGNAALPAARRGARVTGLDFVPELLEQGRALAERDQLPVEWIEGDAEDLPFDDASFDVVLSTFGCMFAPDHRRTAAEIARVLRPGGRMALACWMPSGTIGQFFGMVAKHMPPPPEGFQPPPLWGVPSHVQEIFDGTGMRLVTNPRQAHFRFEGSPEEMFELFTTKFGPVVNAKDTLEPEGRWQPLADELMAYYQQELRPTGDGRLGYEGDYLLTLGTKEG